MAPTLKNSCDSHPYTGLTPPKASAGHPLALPEMSSPPKCFPHIPLRFAFFPVTTSARAGQSLPPSGPCPSLHTRASIHEALPSTLLSWPEAYELSANASTVWGSSIQGLPSAPSVHDPACSLGLAHHASRLSPAQGHCPDVLFWTPGPRSHRKVPEGI